ncbi:helix-turn-helix domain-containing protein [Hansschlegelia sp.]|uniref:helix-turn-helix domain-containing protein n=1 Tax=Hansschlegelia sp. TaxID=2041892 RepID=UPI002C3A3013|nr:helix-turn-helix domain-containing protein [Hansschlegelia sp.]HVI27062.1 helix-turn-helix domain-containing protein [Hansschlegelia sp.]
MASGAAARSVVGFSTAKAGKGGQGGFEAYHDLYGPVADVVALDGRFGVSVEAQRLDEMILFDRRLRSVRHVRCARRVARNGFDHFTAQLALEGAFSVKADEGERVVKRGEMVMIDMTRPMATTATDARVLTLSTPRAVVERLSAGADRLHGAVVPESRAAMFGGLLASFLRFPDEQDPTDRARVAQVATELLSLALSGRPEGEGATALSASDLAARERARRFIDANPAAGPDDVARAVGHSRSSLYRVFAGNGGVARYIRTRRLAKMRALLGRADDTRRIGEIAFACGFASDSDASRAYRAAYGVTPGEYRAARRRGPIAPSGGRSEIARWWDEMR